jgi:hypothetical protein
METGNNGDLLGKAIFAGLVLLLVFFCVFSFCGCAGTQHQNASVTQATVSDVETLDSRLTATLPSPDDPEAWNHGLGLLVGVIVPDMNSGRMVYAGITLFADFGNNTNTDISRELNANLRLLAELTTRVPDLQGVAIISYAESDPDGVNMERAVAITQALIEYGMETEAINYQRPRALEQTEEAETPEAGAEIPSPDGVRP